VDADEDQIIQVLTNLIVNAEQALIDQDGPRKLHLRSYHDTATGQAVVRVADNGPGIPLQVQSRIFEPFFTTKEVGTGTGIGLAFSHRIITAHGGRMKVRSDPGKGARFYIRLDAATGARDVLSETEPVEDGFSGRVLVVDDESGVAELIGDILIEAGYQVEIYNNAADALELLRTQWFDAVVSDIKMPGMDGPAFHEALSAIDPAIAHCTGFVTGDTLSGDVANFLSKTDQPHLEKPVTPLELLDLVGGLIERRRS
jgi:CheY-like chemotaxis protein